jgi:uncharacterized DUF497 family protein
LARVGKLPAQRWLDEPVDRPLCYEREGRLRVTGRVGTHVLVLICEPVELMDGEIAARPISFRDATRAEERHYWRWHG